MSQSPYPLGATYLVRIGVTTADIRGQRRRRPNAANPKLFVLVRRYVLLFRAFTLIHYTALAGRSNSNSTLDELLP
jgi:hypothetical protein